MQMIAPLPHHSKPSNNNNISVKTATTNINFFLKIASVTPQPVTVNRHTSPTSSSAPSTKTVSATTTTKTKILQYSLSSIASYSSIYPSFSQHNNTISNNMIVADQQHLKDDSSSSSDYVIVHNRKYWNDELDRLMNLVCIILSAAFHGNFIAPINDILKSCHNTQQNFKVLDIGCGTSFYGIDNCPLFPTHIKPINAHFRLQDVTKEGLDSFADYVHVRSMIYHFTVMKPGAYFEIVDTNCIIR
ncbi:MAG: hypothetical protein EXX96DRAFT_602070 [Benjaminiella poitrasii]|nr:MAG: hypothetical protein EXX96DRAFT_602070 [Benjaminiella poitrasii]